MDLWITYRDERKRFSNDNRNYYDKRKEYQTNEQLEFERLNKAQHQSFVELKNF